MMNTFALSNEGRLEHYAVVKLSVLPTAGFLLKRSVEVCISADLMVHITQSLEHQCQLYVATQELENVDIAAIIFQHGALPGLTFISGLWGMPVTNIDSPFIKMITQGSDEYYCRSPSSAALPVVGEDMPTGYVWFDDISVRSNLVVFVKTLDPVEDPFEVGFVFHRYRCHNNSYKTIEKNAFLGHSLDSDGTSRNMFAIDENETRWFLNSLFGDRQHIYPHVNNPYGFKIREDDVMSCHTEEEGSVYSMPDVPEVVYLVSMDKNPENQADLVDFYHRDEESSMNIVWMPLSS
jgi:hypothetical protein